MTRPSLPALRPLAAGLILPTALLALASCGDRGAPPAKQAESAQAPAPKSAAHEPAAAVPAQGGSHESAQAQSAPESPATASSMTPTPAAGTSPAAGEAAKSAAGSDAHALAEAHPDAHAAGDGHDDAHAMDDGHGHGADDGHDHGAADDAHALASDVVGDDLPPGEGPRMVWEFGADKVDFGRVMQGDVLSHDFFVESGGTEDLVIKQAKPTCGCTVADLMVEAPDGSGWEVYKLGTPVPPGHKVKITATLQTKNKHGAASSRINIFSNDPRGQRSLGLQAEVEPFFQVNPTHIAFQAMSTSDTAKDKANIRTSNGERVKLEAANLNPPQGVQVELKPLDADAEGRATTWDLEVTAGPGLAEGNLAYAVQLLSDKTVPGHTDAHEGSKPVYDLTVTIMGRVTGMISINPGLISLGLVRPGQVASRTVRLTSHDPAFTLGDPKVHLEDREGGEWELAKHFSTVLRPVEGENAVDVELRLDGMPETLNSSFTGMLVIETGHPDKPEVKLPISGVCRGGVVPPAPR